jgi:hopene-associated glycosyltransferase HpnB
MSVTLAISLLSLAVWLVLIFGRGFFWLARDRDAPAPDLKAWPRVTAVIPARDEADMIGTTLAGLFAQDYPGALSIVLVDDNSTDGTAEVAREAAAAAGASDRLTVLAGAALPVGWTGKLHALKQGVDFAAATRPLPEYLLFTDADILHAPDSVRRLVARASRDGLVLCSLMAKLRCVSFGERALVPAFIFFFQMLYPFGWVNRPARSTAAAAGGCVLLARAALERAGGIAAVRGELIDDCALGRLMKRQGPIRLSLTQRVTSQREYPSLADIHKMVARSAYAQLNYSPWLLAGTVLGMLVTYLAAPSLALFGHGAAQAVGALVWLMMALAFEPILAFYRVSPLWGPALPLIAGAYLVFTLDSARLHASGRGGQWKGRAQALRRSSP